MKGQKSRLLSAAGVASNFRTIALQYLRLKVRSQTSQSTSENDLCTSQWSRNEVWGSYLHELVISNRHSGNKKAGSSFPRSLIFVALLCVHWMQLHASVVSSSISHIKQYIRYIPSITNYCNVHKKLMMHDPLLIAEELKLCDGTTGREECEMILV